MSQTHHQPKKTWQVQLEPAKEIRDPADASGRSKRPPALRRIAQKWPLRFDPGGEAPDSVRRRLRLRTANKLVPRLRNAFHASLLLRTVEASPTNDDSHPRQ